MKLSVGFRVCQRPRSTPPGLHAHAWGTRGEGKRGGGEPVVGDGKDLVLGLVGASSPVLGAEQRGACMQGPSQIQIRMGSTGNQQPSTV